MQDQDGQNNNIKKYKNNSFDDGINTNSEKDLRQICPIYMYKVMRNGAALSQFGARYKSKILGGNIHFFFVNRSN